MINLPSDFASSTVAAATAQFAAFSGITTVLIGILLALLLIGGLVSLIRGRH